MPKFNLKQRVTVSTITFGTGTGTIVGINVNKLDRYVYTVDMDVEKPVCQKIMRDVSEKNITEL